MSEAKMGAAWAAHCQKRDTEALIAEAEYATWRAAERDRVLIEHGFDIGTRQEAIDQTGPYADPENTFRIGLFLTVAGAKIL